MEPAMDPTVQTEVTNELGQWVVYLLVLDEETIERRKLSVHVSEREARVAASVAQRAAHRRRRPPPDDRS
jgi:hypothetical protein